MIDTGGHVIFKRGKKYAAILMARVALEVICSFLHVCSKCRSVNHSFSSCSKRPAASASTNQNAGIATDKGTSKTPIHK
jgi:hypothetical protein